MLARAYYRCTRPHSTRSGTRNLKSAIPGRHLVRPLRCGALPAADAATEQVNNQDAELLKQIEDYGQEASEPQATETAALQMGLADLARQALSADPDAVAQLKRYEAAVVRLEKAKAAEKELESIMKDAMTAALQEDAAAAANAKLRADELLAEAEVAAAERLVQAAELEYSTAVQEQLRVSQALSQDSDRTESGKAAAVAAAGGVAGALPFLLSASAPGLHGLLSLGATAAACLLFGVTYRYAVRQDATNMQLRGGVVAAFGLVKAVGAADIIQATADAGDVFSAAVIGNSALYAAQCMLAFGFAAAALEAGFSNGIVKRMGGTVGRS